MPIVFLSYMLYRVSNGTSSSVLWYGLCAVKLCSIYFYVFLCVVESCSVHFCSCVV